MERFDLKNKKSLMILLSVSLFLLLFISVAFAALSTTLNINVGQVNQNPIYWDVGFVGDYELSEEGTSSTGRVCGSPTITDKSATFSNITLSKPEDACIYDIDVISHSDYTAYLANVDIICPSGVTGSSNNTIGDGTGMATFTQQCGKITYSINGPDKLEANDWIPYRVIVSYNSSSLTSQQTTQSGAKIIVEFADDASQALNSNYY